MFLKSIEIRGFKSFADKTELVFKKGITAVVGPNGSGKSNISDAVRWVLGEQSVRNLRGDKMEDVIFAGTQFRKPVGLAQVSLILDNSDSELDIEYSDVVISRRLYRSGESEYLINNNICRLKDVQMLFMDTGIGKEGYSIIGQGKIDAILSGKPEERRKLLEEAAGIVKYKMRKEESERKLQNTEQNLIRIEDILSTYEERLEPLREESNKAKKFLELSDVLKKSEINIIIDFIEKNQIKISSFKAQCETIGKELREKIEEKDRLKENIEKKQNELEEFESKISLDKQKFYNSKENHQKVLSEIKILQERLNSVENSIEKNILDKEELNIKGNNLKEELEKLNNDLNKIVDSKEEIHIKIKDKEKIIELIINNSYSDNVKLENLKSEKENLNKEKNEKSNKIIILNNTTETINEKLQSLVVEIESIMSSIKINNTTTNSLSNEGKKLITKIQEYEQKVIENKNNIGKFRHSQTLEEKKYKELLATSNRIDANLNMLNNLEKQYEGYARSVKNLMQHIKEKKIKNFNGNPYVLGDILKVDKKFETAIEIALGGNLSNIITENEEEAKTLIQHLKINSLGRATFLPLNIVKGKSIELNNNIKDTEGYIGVASEIISFNLKFKGIIDYLLGKTIICDNMDNAINLARKILYRNKIVTLSGEVINPGGALTGGSIYSKSNNIIGRKREIEELKINFKDITDKISNKKIELNNLYEKIKKLDEENLNLKDEIHFQKIEKTKIDEKINSIKDNSLKLQKELETKKEVIKEKKEELSFSLESIKKLELDLNSLDERVKIIDKDEVNLKNNVKDSNDKISKYKDELTSHKIEKAKLDEMYANKNNEITRINCNIKDNNLKIEQLNRELEAFHVNKNEYIKTLESNKNGVESILNSINEMEKLIENSEVDKIKLKEQLDKIKSQQEGIELEINDVEKEFHKYEVALVKIETEKENSINKLNEEFKLTYAEALNFKEPIEDLSELKNEISEIKSEISSLGSVNVGAIEEYKEVQEKYTFMAAQKEDLTKAKDELLEVIEEMTSKMKEVFKENFIKLRKNFNETFKELFKGGSADLILTDGDELTSKIDINVEPPGKKLQNINLLSGGEKVLSAIALLFAILKMKPTPFCILDEIEAALDDANVIRYAEFLKQFSQNIQFIVITHRKGTMEASDVLYGVTMEEKGVSKIVSVDFTN